MTTEGRKKQKRGMTQGKKRRPGNVAKLEAGLEPLQSQPDLRWVFDRAPPGNGSPSKPGLSHYCHRRWQNYNQNLDPIPNFGGVRMWEFYLRLPFNKKVGKLWSRGRNCLHFHDSHLPAPTRYAFPCSDLRCSEGHSWEQSRELPTKRQKKERKTHLHFILPNVLLNWFSKLPWVWGAGKGRERNFIKWKILGDNWEARDNSDSLHCAGKGGRALHIC